MKWLGLVSWVALVVGGCGEKAERAPPPKRGSGAGAVSEPRGRDPTYDETVEAIRRLLKDNEVGAAVKAARELMDDHRLDAEGWVVIATAYQVAGDAKEALKAAKVAVDKAPDSAAAWVAVGAAERMIGGYAAAEAALKRALELDPGSRAARFNLAGIAADKGQHELAKNELVKLVEADPDDFETRYLLATTFLAMKELGPAREQLAAIIERYPQHFRAQRTLAALAWAEGNYKRAFERAAIAARLSEGDAETARLLEGSFYIVVASRLMCQAGPRPWPADKVVAVLKAIEQEEGLEGAGSFVELDERFGDNEVVQQRVRRAAAAAGCEVSPPAAESDAPPDAGSE